MTDEQPNLGTEDEFNLEEDYEEIPLVPNGFYHGALVGAKYDTENYQIVIDIQLQGNEGQFCSDGTTPVDGQSYPYRLFLPKPGDESERTKSGKQTKRQWKINNMADAFKSLEIEANTPGEIRTQIEDGSWLNDDIKVEMKNEIYQGRTSSKAVGVTAN